VRRVLGGREGCRALCLEPLKRRLRIQSLVFCAKRFSMSCISVNNAMEGTRQPNRDRCARGRPPWTDRPAICPVFINCPSHLVKCKHPKPALKIGAKENPLGRGWKWNRVAHALLSPGGESPRPPRLRARTGRREHCRGRANPNPQTDACRSDPPLRHKPLSRRRNQGLDLKFVL
jgi:hypothetical protein